MTDTLDDAMEDAWRDAHRGLGPVLVVDDSDAVRTAVRILLEHEGYEVCEAASGAGAIQMTQLWLPRLVLLDLELPDMEGWEVLERLRREPAAQDAVILLFSARADVQTRERARTLNVSMLVKPAAAAAILHEVQRHLRTEEAAHRFPVNAKRAS